MFNVEFSNDLDLLMDLNIIISLTNTNVNFS